MRKSYNEVYNDVVKKAEQHKKKVNKIKVTAVSLASVVVIFVMAIVPVFAFNKGLNQGDANVPEADGSLPENSATDDDISFDIIKMDINITSDNGESFSTCTNKQNIYDVVSFVNNIREKNSSLDESIFDEDNNNDQIQGGAENMDYLIYLTYKNGAQSYITVTRHYVKEYGKKVVYLKYDDYKAFENIIKNLS